MTTREIDMFNGATLVYGLLAVLITILLGEDLPLGSPVPWMLGSFSLRIDFMGLVDLVSDRSTETPGQASILMPNATNPQACWIPDVLKHNSTHHPRLLIQRGSVHPTSQVKSQPSGHPADRGLEMVDLSSKHVSLQSLSPALKVDRTCRGNPNVDPIFSVNYQADGEELATLAVMNDGSDLGSVSQTLLQPEYSETNSRIISRVHVNNGVLETTRLWKEQNKTEYYEIEFPQKPGDIVALYKQYLAKTLTLTANAETDLLTLNIRPLADLNTDQNLILTPDGREVDLIVKNSESTEVWNGDAHFSSHYLIRDGYERLTKIRFPDPDWGVDPSGSNPQCSPSDNNG